MLESLVADKENGYARLRTPGRIQGFGTMLALHPRTLRVLCASENSGAELGIAQPELLGRALAEFAGPQSSIAELREAAADEMPVFQNPVPLEVGGRRFDAVLHAQDGLIIAELEKLVPGAPGRADLDRLNDDAIGGMMVPDTLAALMEAGPAAIRAATDFDRVMLYKFDEGYRGQVVGEARRPGVDSFMGLFFPESDIGPPARQLYEQNFCRYIPHISGASYRVLPMENPLTGRALDMSQSILRAVVPCHTEYLSNMGVAASMSFSIMSDGKLWGLFACHHYQPAQLSYVQRLVCEQIAMMFAAKLEEVVNPAALLEEMAQRRDAVLAHSPVCRPNPLGHAWSAAEEQALLALVDADGAAIYLDGQVGQIGSCPDFSQLHGYITAEPERFGRLLHMYDDAGLFYTNSVVTVLPFGEAMREKASGMLAIPLSRKPGHYLMWFRPELVVKASWGGNPGSTQIADPNARFSPRKSFAAWKEDIRDRAEPWQPVHIANAAALRDHMLDRAG
jgi:light-regulated signal transduction histidine kinase (bacteriophytochrome)